MDIQLSWPVSAAPTAIKPVVAAQPVAPVPRDLQQTIAAVAEQLRAYLRAVDRDLEFRVDEDNGTTVISVRNATTGDLIRQIPSEEALRIRHRTDEVSGTLIDLFA